MPTNGLEFKEIEGKWPHFKEEPRNPKISLVADSVNIFGEMRSTYSMWPIFVINNKIPPWMTIKRDHLMLVLIILGILSFNSHLN